MKRKMVRRKTTPIRKPKKKVSVFSGKLVRYLIVTFVIVLVIAVGYHYRDGLAYYFSFKSDKILKKEAEAKRISDVRNFQVLEKHEGKSVGLDVSEYQGKIQWTYVDTLEQKYPLDFVFIRATVGRDRKDRRFDRNWLGAKENKMIRGAYHYYRPNENSLEQAELFIKTVTLQKGDLPPVLDIEKLPKNQSLDRLKVGLKRWLKRVELHYEVKPIIYTGEKYYDDFLKEEFSDYLFWIANYNFYREEINEDWLFWQFTEKASVPGIKGNVDVNIYNGDLQQLQFITKE
ncbi:GH25 family lysozyme [Flavobacterium gawalongense]|uniref:Glycoside hydrolase family 25 protein n=1 Tax=Flavobacterium gawalongense TaxID=2594432 RepID=A0A553BYU9_9FLAO|nr:GH25 family lysozyme [Flavobacterium gawalongense]TRX04567.1 glycoside hydrolase family 25 protein [Flavobacterium gawalongense]TRX10454.1 glycoside hydrolase family 25 protein [Flavobacterium gawalongense]TRX13500.1 glycoside hydrolase family 25 protein [Flavobacterium gawalongense]TRX15568.1 glycoside hydrolase family 25 protein [Flavobacterium gawalongense]TRX31407.1 glycoside hydrolase family 25 protein [Flavobacterium gawalongense]